MSQQQPRLLLRRRTLDVLYLTISRQGRIAARLAQAPAGNGRFTPLPLNDHPFAASGFIGDYQALAASDDTGFALWNDGGSGRLEIVAQTFPAALSAS
jgi:hypothetical protein